MARMALACIIAPRNRRGIPLESCYCLQEELTQSPWLDEAIRVDHGESEH